MKHRLVSSVSPGRVVHAIGFCEYLSRPTVCYANTTSNVLKAMRTRVFIDAPDWEPPSSLAKTMDAAARRLAPQLEQEYDELRVEMELKKFPPAKRQLYGEALKVRLELPKHAKISGFVKCENVPFKPTTGGKIADKPRMIMARDPVFLAHALSAMKPIEHAFYHGRWLWNKHQKHTCAKSMNPIQRMRCLEGMVRELSNPVVIGLDGSAFDAHVTKGALKAEWKFYSMAARHAGFEPTTLKKIEDMGRAQLKNKVFVRTDDGTVKATVEGNRMSGDLNTGLGNSLLQSGYIACMMKEFAVPERHYRFLVDGDDSVVMVSGEYASRFTTESVTKMFAKFSQEVKVEYIRPITLDTMEAVCFCQCSPVRVDGEWRLLRSPYKVYNGYKMVNIWYRSKEEAARFFASVAQPELIMASGVPVHQEFFNLMHRLSGDAKPADHVSRRFWIRTCKSLGEHLRYSSEISNATRLSYQRAFGIGIAEQLLIESALAGWTSADLPSAPESEVTQSVR